MAEVYITGLASYLPGKPVENDDIEKYLGIVNHTPSITKSLILRNNGIKKRFYAIHHNGTVNLNNTHLTSLAIMNLMKDFDADFMPQMLACGTTFPDQILPSHASMVHGELKWNPLETITCSGSCLSGFHALKTAFVNVKSESIQSAVCTASELYSPSLKSGQFEEESKHQVELDKAPYIAFERDFLRWMLSDGAVALMIQDQAQNSGLNLRIDWMETISYAGELETCMYSGLQKKDNAWKSWREISPVDWARESVFAINQDTRLLAENILLYGAKFLQQLVPKYQMKPAEIDWFLPHISSMFFYNKVKEVMKSIDFEVPDEKWFTNLPWVGNVGSASIFLILDEMLRNSMLKKGQKLLLMVPESARFSYGYAHLTVV